MYKRLLWSIEQIFGGFTITYLREEIGRKIVAFKLWLVFRFLVPCLNYYSNLMDRSGIRHVAAWLYYPKDLTETDRSHLFVAAFVSFLFLNVGAILLFSYLAYNVAWFFFAVVLTLLFLVILFYLDYMKIWVGTGDGRRPDEQCTGCNPKEIHSPLAYYLRVFLFLLAGEVKKMSTGFIWFLFYSFGIVLPLYLRFW